MRILLAIHHVLDPDSGAAGATLDLGAALERRGHDVEYRGFESITDQLSDKLKKVVFPFALARHLVDRRAAFDVVDGASSDLAAALAVRRLWPRQALPVPNRWGW